jgi:hypothetical protein
MNLLEAVQPCWKKSWICHNRFAFFVTAIMQSRSIGLSNVKDFVLQSLFLVAGDDRGDESTTLRFKQLSLLKDSVGQLKGAEM